MHISSQDEGRTIYLEQPLTKLLKIQKLKKGRGCPFAFQRGSQRIKDFRGAWKKACQEVDIEGKLFHDLRKTGVRNMRRAGIPKGVAMRISGHKSRSVFPRYNIVSPEDLKEAARKISRFHKAVTKTVTVDGYTENPAESNNPQVVQIKR